MKKTSVLLGLLFATALVVNAQREATTTNPRPPAETQAAAPSDVKTKMANDASGSCCHTAKMACHSDGAGAPASAETPGKGNVTHSKTSGHSCH